MAGRSSSGGFYLQYSEEVEFVTVCVFDPWRMQVRDCDCLPVVGKRASLYWHTDNNAGPRALDVM